ncbi:uncharacterized protein [Onthophagus taurus]|uniref:uncharacterized protein n=1 Tax=Onthophagus taurus TaxID=166361 RepID=UPI0039BE4C42
MENKTIFFIILDLFVLFSIQNRVQCSPIEKKSAAPERVTDDSDYIFDVKYDEYPMVVPRKRAALLVDRLMVALQKAIEEEDQRNIEAQRKHSGYGLRQDDVRSMDLQRRGHGGLTNQQKGRVYWRCYFNAVTCF